MRNAFLMLVMMVSISAQPAVAAKSADYKPSNGMYVMEVHFGWCGEAKSGATRLKCYEKFWEQHQPDNNEFRAEPEPLGPKELNTENVLLRTMAVWDLSQ